MSAVSRLAVSLAKQPIKMKTINLVLRSESGLELSHQGFAPEDHARAERIMIARNRAEMNANSKARWGIETLVPEFAEDAMSLGERHAS